MENLLIHGEECKSWHSLLHCFLQSPVTTSLLCPLNSIQTPSVYPPPHVTIDPRKSGPSHYWGFSITLRHTGWHSSGWVISRDLYLYLTTYNIHKRHTSMPLLLWTSDQQRPLLVPDNIQHSQETDIYAPTPLDKWSAETSTHTWQHTTFTRDRHPCSYSSGQVISRDLYSYLTTYNTHKRHTSMPPAGFKPTIPTNKQLQTHSLNCASTWISNFSLYSYLNGGNKSFTAE
jgi:hypothetical protein